MEEATYADELPRAFDPKINKTKIFQSNNRLRLGLFNTPCSWSSRYSSDLKIANGLTSSNLASEYCDRLSDSYGVQKILEEDHGRRNYCTRNEIILVSFYTIYRLLVQTQNLCLSKTHSHTLFIPSKDIHVSRKPPHCHQEFLAGSSYDELIFIISDFFTSFTSIHLV